MLSLPVVTVFIIPPTVSPLRTAAFFVVPTPYHASIYVSCSSRRNGGLDARSREGGGRAGERERERAGFFADKVQETRRDKRARVSGVVCQ